MTFSLDNLIPGATSGGTWYFQKQESNGTYSTTPTICSAGTITNTFTTAPLTLNQPTGNTSSWFNTVGTITGSDLDTGMVAAGKAVDNNPGVWRLLYMVGNCSGSCFSTSSHTVVTAGDAILPDAAGPYNVCVTALSSTTCTVTLANTFTTGAISNLGPGTFPDLSTIFPAYAPPVYKISFGLFTTGSAQFTSSTATVGNNTYGTTTDLTYSATPTADNYNAAGVSATRTIFPANTVYTFSYPVGTTSFTAQLKIKVETTNTNTIINPPACIKEYVLANFAFNVSASAGTNSTYTICA